MLTYILKRLALMVPTLIGMTLLLFALVRFAPGLTSGAAYGTGAMRSQAAREAAEAKLKARLHLTDAQGHPIPLPKQYALWLYDTVRGEFGESTLYGRPVAELIRQRLPVTLALNLISTFLIYLIAIPGGMLASVQRGKSFDVAWSLCTVALYSLPIIWVGDLMIGFLANPQHYAWFPAAGTHSTNTEWFTAFQYAADYVWHIILPVLCLTYGGFAYLTKLERATMLDNLSQDYVRTARAKGLSEVTVITRHVFRNSLLPMITVFATIVPSLLGGAVIVESIFSIKGMGDLILNATLSRDLPIVQAVAFITSIIALVCLLLGDLAYCLVDPRVSYD